MLRRIYILAGLIIFGLILPTLSPTATYVSDCAHRIIAAASNDGVTVTCRYNNACNKVSVIPFTSRVINIIWRKAPLSAMDLAASQDTAVGRPFSVTSTMISKNYNQTTILRPFMDRHLLPRESQKDA